MNVGSSWCNATGSLRAPRSGHATIMMFLFFNLFILKHPDHHQTLISSLLSYPGPIHKMSLQSVNDQINTLSPCSLNPRPGMSRSVAQLYLPRQNQSAAFPIVVSHDTIIIAIII